MSHTETYPLDASAESVSIMAHIRRILELSGRDTRAGDNTTVAGSSITVTVNGTEYANSNLDYESMPRLPNRHERRVAAAQARRRRL
jgi:hypothetical protein